MLSVATDPPSADPNPHPSSPPPTATQPVSTTTAADSSNSSSNNSPLHPLPLRQTNPSTAPWRANTFSFSLAFSHERFQCSLPHAHMMPSSIFLLPLLRLLQAGTRSFTPTSHLASKQASRQEKQAEHKAESRAVMADVPALAHSFTHPSAHLAIYSYWQASRKSPSRSDPIAGSPCQRTAGTREATHRHSPANHHSTSRGRDRESTNGAILLYQAYGGGERASE